MKDVCVDEVGCIVVKTIAFHIVFELFLKTSI